MEYLIFILVKKINKKINYLNLIKNSIFYTKKLKIYIISIN